MSSIFLLDTNIIIDSINNRNWRPQHLETLVDQGILLACTSINVTEVYMGMLPHEASATNLFLSGLEFYPVTGDAAQLAGQMFSQWRKKGITLSLSDTTIAAVCLTYGLTLVTDNQKHFPMPELRLYTIPISQP